MARSSEPPVAPPAPAASPEPKSKLRLAAAALLALATVLALWLALVSWQSGQVPGCDAAGCGVVLTSKWSKIFGVPVGLFGTGLYATLAWFALRGSAPRRGMLTTTLTATLALLVPAAAAWFAALQLFVLKAFCPWCSGTHLVATTGAILFLVAWSRETAAAPSSAKKPASAGRVEAPTSPLPWGQAAALSLLAFVGFVGAQVASPEPPRAKIITASMGPGTGAVSPPAPTDRVGAPATNPAAPHAIGSVSNQVGSSMAAASTTPTNPPPLRRPTDETGPRELLVHQGQFRLKVAELPILGDPTAKHLVVMISDYTCKYCRAAHRILHDVRDAFGPEELGILMLPTHHGGESEEIQRMMLATWRVNPAVWTTLADDLYSERHSLQPASVRSTLEQKLGREVLAGAMSDHLAWTTNLFALSREIYATNKAMTKSGSIPQFLIGSEIVVGAPADAAEFFGLLEKNLGLVRDKLPELTLALASASADLGKGFAGTTRPLSLLFTNTGKAPLRVNRANLPPGGRVLRGVNQPVAPGQTSSVEVLLLMPRDEGDFEQNLVLHSNARTPETRVALRGRAWKPLKITPPYLDFGRLDPANTATQGVMKIEFFEEAFLESVRSSNPGYEVALREIKPGREYELAVSTTANLARGSQQVSLVSAFRKPVPAGWPESVAVGARAVVEPAVSVVPPRLVVSSAAAANEQHYQLMVRCSDGFEGFAVTEAILEGGPSVTRPEIRPGGNPATFVVVLSLPAGWNLATTATGAQVVLHTNHPKYPRLEIPFVPAEGEVKPAR